MRLPVRDQTDRVYSTVNYKTLDRSICDDAVLMSPQLTGSETEDFISRAMLLCTSCVVSERIEGQSSVWKICSLCFRSSASSQDTRVLGLLDLFMKGGNSRTCRTLTGDKRVRGELCLKL